MNDRGSRAMTFLAGGPSRRWLGPALRGPVWGGTDRTATAARLILIALLVTVVPVAALAVGRWVDSADSHAARAQAASGRLVRTVLTEQAPQTGRSGDLFAPAQLTWVPARWVAPDGQVRIGEVLAPPGAGKGTTVLAWTTSAGTITGFPRSHDQIVGDAVDAAMSAAAALVLALLAGWAVTLRVLDRRLAVALATAQAPQPPQGRRATRRPAPRRRIRRRAAPRECRQAAARRRRSGRRGWAAGW